VSRPGFSLLLFDLDGTLLNPDRAIHPELAAHLRELMDEGIRVGFATGRSRVSVRPFVEYLDPNGPLVLFNGCQVWMPRDKSAFLSFSLPPKVVEGALKIAREQNLHANVYVGRDLFVRERDALSLASEIKDGVPHTEVGDLQRHLDVLQKPVTKILFIGEDAGLKTFRASMTANGVGPCALVRSEPTYLEVLPAGVNKGMALGPIFDRLGVPATSVMAFGDNLNDLELVQRAGWGVAMDNAHPGLKAVADAVIGDHRGDAILKHLKSAFQVDAGRLIHLSRRPENP
jgi:Cof subfamily protein (haloacid dehalogenase superfamily)